ncbi:hypothetical protein DICPUDRAFT_54676 [Dictyostelium purpureum]|uniref:Steroid dehydrogenase n=1 Tax=Dictyostelium purpureum TaxID=5786 RepID=F0ZI70_DICPU|nr:uncharacterized protein DICPUDRAFT_54676 [Dictyostelium purpureum]EGC36368.1 hypothetical protein DICPUDRAFT_54676 [Dictyostelium purpureum]|eukprot:XP_003287122.1 hypothetical protein DICPUDRAFT_54676 [Dictyostelium purpureum]
MIEVIKSLSLAIGLGVIIRFVYHLAMFVFAFTFRAPINIKKYGSWVGKLNMVTGATDGIGKAYCHQFAKKGLKICLVSRNQEKLDSVASEIEKKYKVKTKVISFDFDTPDDTKYQTLFKQLSSLDIGVLVNNVGIGYDPMLFEELQPSVIESLININIRPLTVLSRLVIPKMVEKRRGCIINISSITAIAPGGCPLLSVYCGTKAFIEKFSLSLNYEYATKGVFVQCVTPAIVASNMSKISKPSLFIASPEALAISAVSTIGYEKITTGYWTHELQAFFIKNLPQYVSEKFLYLMCFYYGERNKKI